MIIDHIYILIVKSHPLSETLKLKLDEYFPGVPYSRWDVSGIHTHKNEGAIETSSWQILAHTHVDEVARDIANNHIDMIRDAWKKGHEYALFLEEDASWESDGSLFRNTWRSIVRYEEQTPAFFDILYLGYCNWPYLVSFMVNSALVRPVSPLLAHAYLLSRGGMKKILDAWDDDRSHSAPIHIDRFFGTLGSLRRWATHPILCHQSKNPALMTKLLDRCNLDISNKKFLQIFHLLSILVSFLLVSGAVALLFKCLSLASSFLLTKNDATAAAVKPNGGGKHGER